MNSGRPDYPLPKIGLTLPTQKSKNDGRGVSITNLYQETAADHILPHQVPGKHPPKARLRTSLPPQPQRY